MFNESESLISFEMLDVILSSLANALSNAAFADNISTTLNRFSKYAPLNKNISIKSLPVHF